MVGHREKKESRGMKAYFYPGLGADSSLAPFHVIPGVETQWIEWPKWFGRSWEEFIREIKRENRFEANALHIGISFGGLVAQRMADDLDGKAEILIGSFSSLKAIAGVFRFMLPWLFMIPEPFFEIRFLPRFLIRYFFGIAKPEELELFYAMARKLSGGQVKSLIRFIRPAAIEASRGFSDSENRQNRLILRIHGTRDRILPIGNQVVDVRIEGGGHLISLTHPGEINAHIAEWLART